MVVNRYQVLNKNKFEGMSESGNVDFSWHQTSQGKDLISSLRQPFGKCFLPKIFDKLNFLILNVFINSTGIFEKPLAIQNTNYDILEYKLLLYGKSGVGKSSLVSKLLNCPIQPNYYETPGLPSFARLNFSIVQISSGILQVLRCLP